MALTAAEQYLIELINRARLDPSKESQRYDLALNAGLASGTITTSAKQVLAPNALLETAAVDHSDWMLAEDIFSHTGDGNSNPGNRMAAAGYEFTGSWTWRENLAWTGTTGNLSLTQAIEDHHEGLYRSSGHRVNTFANDIREIGIAQVEGQFTSGGVTYNASMLTENFAKSGSDVFVTGVSYTDSDGDAFYDIGEGTDGVWVSVGGTRVDTAAAGGYGVATTAGDDVAVTVGAGNATLAALRMDLSDGNGKLDIVTDSDGGQWLALSVSATLVSGLGDAVLLGVADLTLTGNAGDNQLLGNDGDNALYGGAGADHLEGGAGDDMLEGGMGRDVEWSARGGLGESDGVSDNADTLLGGAGNDLLSGFAGNDVLDGGAGDDILTGGSGRDSFVFSGGRDTVTDFTDNVDTLCFDADALGYTGLSSAEMLAIATVSGDSLIFALDSNVTLTVQGITDVDLLANDLMII